MKKMQHNALNIKSVAKKVWFFLAELRGGIRGNYHESSDCFEYPKSLLKSSYPKKNTCQQKSGNKKFQTPKNPSIHPVTWNPEYHFAG